MKKLALSCIVCTIGFVSMAQKNNGTYNWAVGVKYRPAALSLKKYTAKGDAIEFLLSKYDEGTRLATLFELAPKLNKSGSLRFIAGTGLHIAIWDKGTKLNSYTKNPIIGIDAIFGFEYKVPKVPIAFQLDYQPAIDFFGNDETHKTWGGLTIKFAW